uniref:polyprenol reductase-like n=1 Tax=Styela clava TaxID=7725 RepID=UPI0019398D53|nr:polyprenol reductase-like [Styela clava]
MDYVPPTIGDTIELLWFIMIFLLVLLLVALCTFNKENGGVLWQLMTIASQYGKLNSGKAIKFFNLPKKIFTHFYAISVLWNLIFIADLSIIFWFSDTQKGLIIKYIVPESSTTRNLITKKSLLLAFTLILIQGCRRLYECIYVSKFSKQATINSFHYFLGVFFYIFEPLTIVSKIGAIEKLPSGDIELRHFVGIILFVVASHYQNQSFHIFAKLRKTSDKSEYKIPTGDLFEIVSCPHYFTEILIYTALTFIVGFSHYSWRYAIVFVIVIHIGMAKMSHEWYLSTFKQYPKHRRALIPFVY